MHQDNSMRHFAVMDLGGTKAEAILFREDGQILSRIVRPGGTPFEDGPEKARSNAISVIQELLSMHTAPISALYCSIASVHFYQDYFEEGFHSAFPQIGTIRLEGDGMCLISGMLGHNDGASMICGTGSALFMRKGDEYCNIGGGGHLIDSCGSGFMLGRLAIQAALRADDGSADPTILGDLIRQKAGKAIWKELTSIYAGGRPYVASFAPCVFAARNAGDHVARRIFNRCAADLADLTWAARKKLGGGYTLVLNGGIFRNFPEYAEAVKAGAPKDVNLVLPNVPPIYGCTVEALYDVGISCSDSFRETFLSCYSHYE